METKVEHTKGPWHESHEFPYGFSVAHEIAPKCSHLLVVATCGTQKQYLGYEIDRETAKANARLIAAAPEMLEVLELLHRLTLQTPSLANDPDSREVMDRAWMIIHKARGDV